MSNVPGWIEGLPVIEVLCERPNPSGQNHVFLYAWCKHCERLHKHGDRRIHREEFVPRAAHCGKRSPHSHYLLHRVPLPRMHTQDGITAPVLDVVGWWGDKARALCPKCCKTHVYHVERGVEYTLVDGRCYPKCFVRQEVEA